jgi:hypothetical protein
MEPKTEELRNKYGHWGYHPDFPVKDWRHEVADNDTRLGYWEWIAARMEEE